MHARPVAGCPGANGGRPACRVLGKVFPATRAVFDHHHPREGMQLGVAFPLFRGHGISSHPHSRRFAKKLELPGVFFLIASVHYLCQQLGLSCMACVHGGAAQSDVPSSKCTETTTGVGRWRCIVPPIGASFPTGSTPTAHPRCTGPGGVGWCTAALQFGIGWLILSK